MAVTLTTTFRTMATLREAAVAVVDVEDPVEVSVVVTKVPIAAVEAVVDIEEEEAQVPSPGITHGLAIIVISPDILSDIADSGWLTKQEQTVKAEVSETVAVTMAMVTEGLTASSTIVTEATQVAVI